MPRIFQHHAGGGIDTSLLPPVDKYQDVVFPLGGFSATQYHQRFKKLTKSSLNYLLRCPSHTGSGNRYGNASILNLFKYPTDSRAKLKPPDFKSAVINSAYSLVF